MILCSQAKLENDQKGINVKRGIRAKCEMAWRPGPAPLGYINRSFAGVKEIADNAGVIRVFGFYIESNDQNNPYILHDMYQADKVATVADLEKAKIEMGPKTVKEVTIDSYKGMKD